MKFSIFPRYGALNSKPVFEAFVKGAIKLGYEVVEHDMSADIFVIWSVLWSGRMQANQEIWKIAKKQKKPVLILEVGGLIRGTTWRVGLNHVNANGFFGNLDDLDAGRPEKLGIFLKEWKNTGENILICGQHTLSEQWSQLPLPEIWLENIVSEIKKFTDRKIVFRPHPRDYAWCQKLGKIGVEIRIPQKISGTYDDFDHHNDFAHAWCVVNLSGNTGILSAIDGIPVFSSIDSLAYPVSTKNFEKIETLDKPDRRAWLTQVCHTEWTLEEISNGEPIRRIFDKKLTTTD